MEKCTTEPVKAYLNSDMETIRSHSISESIEFLKGYWNLKNNNIKCHIIF